MQFSLQLKLPNTFHCKTVLDYSISIWPEVFYDGYLHQVNVFNVSEYKTTFANYGEIVVLFKNNILKTILLWRFNSCALEHFSRKACLKIKCLLLSLKILPLISNVWKTSLLTFSIEVWEILTAKFSKESVELRRMIPLIAIRCYRYWDHSGTWPQN